MSWQMIDDLTGDRIEDPEKSGVLAVLLDNDQVAVFDVDPTVYTREQLLAALGEHLVDHAVPFVPAHERPLDPGPLDAPDDPSPAVPPARGEADAPAPDPAGEGRAPAAATNGHAITPIGDGVSYTRDVAPDGQVTEHVDGGEGNGLGPYGSDEAPTATPEREPDALTRAEELLESHWTPRQVADTVGLELAEVQDIQRNLRQRAKGKKK